MLELFEEKGVIFSEDDIDNYMKARKSYEISSLEGLKCWDVILFFCLNLDKKLPPNSYKRRTAIVFPGIDRKKDYVKLITTTTTYSNEQYWKVPIIDWQNEGFTQQVYFNENDFKEHILKKKPFAGTSMSKIIKKVGVLSETDQKTVMGMYDYYKNGGR